MTFSFFVHGTPVPQPRARARVGWKHGKPYPVMYDGDDHGVKSKGRARAWKRLVALQSRLAIKGIKTPIDCPLVVDMEFFFQRPKAHSKKAPKWHSSNFDCDNLAKAVLDALVGAELIRDDSLVFRLTAQKSYCSESANPGMNIEITTHEQTYV